MTDGQRNSQSRGGQVTNPASSGPAGSHFEGQVGAHYLLSLLTGAEPRGLPATTIDRIELQRASEGRPLDDIIVHAHDWQGRPAILEIQVKRSITFTPSDPVFRSVVGQILAASRRPDFWNSHYELAIAIARTSRKIDSAYQDVLTWARRLEDAATFTARIGRSGSANEDMRTFVRTFKSHLHDAGGANDDETVWRLLCRLQILVFDFTTQGSASEELAKERATRALHSDDTPRAGNLWTTLIELAIQTAATAGDRTRDKLIDDLRSQSFRLAGDRRYLSARAALAEASRHALADISDRVGDVMLTRNERVAAVHAALDEGRYVEIRGDAGVGKSGVLKHFANQMATEAQVIVLSPGRTIPRGWTAMRAMLGFDGTSREFLSDLAADGGATLFVDNLDFFGDEERRTVIDLVREAANLSGLSVIATARRDFGVIEPSWLPKDALDTLGRAAPVVIDELSEIEVDELRNAAPPLAALLAEGHPAREVARNLFRLARLANRQDDMSIPRTEVDMAEQWWGTADGRLDEGHRERARLLKVLAEEALFQTEPLDVRDRPATAVNALVASETLRDLGADRVAFRHDVLREWAIANALFADPTVVRLPLGRPAPTALARGVELCARMTLERASESTRWQSLLTVVSQEGAHGSWRRAVLLALVRSEIGSELLERASSHLLADRAHLLCELIRTVMAVDVQPAAELFAAAGVDPAVIRARFNVPDAPSWPRLIVWLLRLGERLPAGALPDVVHLYAAWSMGMMGRDALTPVLLPWLYRWLIEIEAARENRTPRKWSEPFGGQLDHHQLDALESDLRYGFLLFCNRTPELAAQYLRSLGQRRYNHETIRSILKFRGALAQVAPKDLADLTYNALIPKKSDDQHDNSDFERPFGFADLSFVPASPAQGPFLELLTHAPEHGLRLIHRLVDHAISFYARGNAYGSDAITISFPDGERVFPWVRSYSWSREGGGPSSVTSALMALEAWGHGRVETGESLDHVLADVLGPAASPAAYLLVAVDLLLSHWPKSREAAVPFVATPELLCLDRERQLHDDMELPDMLGLKALQKEPVGAANLESLKKRASRRLSLDQLLGHYTLGAAAEVRSALVDLLRRAATRLGPPAEHSDLGDPEFMVVHAMNLLDRNNWQEVSVTGEDGAVTTGLQYVSPPNESRHLEALQEASRDQHSNIQMQAAIKSAVDPSRSSPEFAAAAVAWAQRVAAEPKDGDTGRAKMREEAIVTAAMLAARDGSAELRAQHEAWMRGVFFEALMGKDDPVHRVRSGLQFNQIAIAYVGMIHLLKGGPSAEDVRGLLEVAARDNPAAAHGFAAAADTLAAIDERLPRAVLRCAFAAQIQPSREWRLSDAEVAARSELHRRRIQATVDAETAWLAGMQGEPDWPTFPLDPPRPQHRFRILAESEQPEALPTPYSRPEQYTDHQGAALWLRAAAILFDITKRPWLRDVLRAYVHWTMAANGAGLNENEEVEDAPREWNDVYFNLLAYCLPGLASQEVDEIALTPINSLPDEPFFDVVTPFLRSVDSVYFNNGGLLGAQAVRIRSVLARRLMASWGWRRLRGSRSTAIEVHIAPAIATFFFNDYDSFQGAQCYLRAKGIDRLESFIPVLQELAEGAPCFFVGHVTLNLFEVSPRAAHLPFMVAAAKTWLTTYSDDKTFWVDNEIGRRLCVRIEALRDLDPTAFSLDPTLRTDVDRLLAELVRLGVSEAHRLEESLRLLA